MCREHIHAVDSVLWIDELAKYFWSSLSVFPHTSELVKLLSRSSVVDIFILLLYSFLVFCGLLYTLIEILLICFFSPFGSTRVGIQGLCLLSKCSTIWTTSPVFFALVNFSDGIPQVWLGTGVRPQSDSPISVSLIAGITGLNHHTKSYLFIYSYCCIGVHCDIYKSSYNLS
jgi:hypothetical protein